MPLIFLPRKSRDGSSSTSVTMQRNQWYIQLQSPVHIFAPLRFFRFLKGMRLELSCPRSSQLSGWKKSCLFFTLPSPGALSGAGGTHKGEVESYNRTHCFGRERVKNSQKAKVVRLKDEHKSMWGEHSGRINCWEGVSRGGCENFCNMKRLYLQSLQKLWSGPPSLSHTHI